ncbi:MAG: tetratricopeptide repeat protein [Rhodocyclaceae bacterium]|nr:tetratricopeptide repeat protein [Rhodocyclaceae bacterium]
MSVVAELMRRAARSKCSCAGALLLVAGGTTGCWLPLLLGPWASNAAAQTPAADQPALRISKAQPKLDPVLTRAFAALSVGDLEAADGAYAAALKSEASNPDALHGAAVVALRKNQRERAEEFYRRAVAADPTDAIAQAGLSGLGGNADPVAAESRLKTLIAAQPDQHCLQFALGNAYAAAGRWHDAQQAFFRAYSAAPDQPDYLFNLAVSLDHLRQAALARRYYAQALAAAEQKPASFDPAQAAARLRELRP